MIYYTYICLLYNKGMYLIIPNTGSKIALFFSSTADPFYSLFIKIILNITVKYAKYIIIIFQVILL